MTAAATHARYTRHTVRCLKTGPAALADYLATMKAKGWNVHPSQKTIAAALGKSTRTIHRWTEELKAAGVLTVEGHPARHDHITGRWKRQTNRYFCHFRKTKRGPMRPKHQVTPRRHLCHQDSLYEEPRNEAAPSSVDMPPTKPPDASEPALGPPWLRLGITRYQWKLMMEEEDQ